MSILQPASEALRDAIQTGLETAGTGLVTSGARVALASPASVVREATNDTLVVFLFRTETDTTGRNRPTRGASGTLPVRLWFLITPFALNPQNDNLLLGTVMQILHDKPVIPFGAGPGGSLRVEFNSLSVSDLASLWSSLGVPFRLSATYQVSIVQ